MYKKDTFLAIIPARSGSKRLPNKNILDLNGKPLVAWSIEAAKKSRYIDEIIVSSDSNEILKIAENLNVKSLKRPKRLSSDKTSSIEVVEHVLKKFPNFKYIVLLQPTSPLRNENHIDEAIELLKEKDSSAIISVTKMEHSPLWAISLKDDLSFDGFLDKNALKKRSQDLEIYFRPNGAIFIGEKDELLAKKSFYMLEKVFAYKMSQISSIDIDTKFDFDIAKCIVSNLQERKA